MGVTQTSQGASNFTKPTASATVMAGNSETVGVLDRRMAMAQVIEFYVPDRFRKKVKWIPATQRGKLIEFPMQVKKSA
jgi:hypothetical protein